MDFIKNFPFFSIMLCMFCAIVNSVLGRRASKYMTRIVLGLVMCLSVAILFFTIKRGEAYVYYMGHFPAPWGNEIRFGCLESLFSLFVSMIAFLSTVAGTKAVEDDVEDKKENLFYILVCLMTSSLLAMSYTNDLFTGYVFIEINTIAGCGLIMIRQIGKTTVTAIRYMVISILGSGLFLMGVTLLYTLTGHLLMSNIKESVAELCASGEYKVQLTIVIGLMLVGLAIKSGLFPFHLWIPDAYGQSNVVSSSLLSSIVSKGYIFLLIKIFVRTIGFDVIKTTGVLYICFTLGIIAMILGSVMALHEKSFRRMIAYSSIAQIGYIYMGIGLGTAAGVAAAIFHIFAHGATKSLLFISSSEFTEGSHTKSIDDLKGLGHKYKFSAFCYSVGAFSIVGFPLLAGFVSKLLLGGAAIGRGPMQWIALLALAVSTILNTIYFLKTVIYLYIPYDEEHTGKSDDMVPTYRMNCEEYVFGVIMLVAVNLILGLASGSVIDVINNGLEIFS